MMKTMRAPTLSREYGLPTILEKPSNISKVQAVNESGTTTKIASKVRLQSLNIDYTSAWSKMKAEKDSISVKRCRRNNPAGMTLGKWTQDENKGLNMAFAKANHLFQGAENPTKTELQSISTDSGLKIKTVKSLLENLCGKIYSALCIIYYTRSTYTWERGKKK